MASESSTAAQPPLLSKRSPLARLLEQERQLWQSSAFVPYTVIPKGASQNTSTTNTLVAIEGQVNLLIGSFTFPKVQFYTTSDACSPAFPGSPPGVGLATGVGGGGGGRRGSFAALQQLLDLSSRKDASTYNSESETTTTAITNTATTPPTTNAITEGSVNQNSNNASNNGGSPGIKEVLLKNPGLVQLLSGGGGNSSKKSGPVSIPSTLGRPLIFQFSETPDSYWFFPTETTTVQKLTEGIPINGRISTNEIGGAADKPTSITSDLSITFRLNPASAALSLINVNGGIGSDRKVAATAALPHAKMHMIIRGASEVLVSTLLHSCYDPLTAFAATLPVPADLPTAACPSFARLGFKECVLPFVAPHGILENLTRIVKSNSSTNPTAAASSSSNPTNSTTTTTSEEPSTTKKRDPKPSTSKRKQQQQGKKSDPTETLAKPDTEKQSSNSVVESTTTKEQPSPAVQLEKDLTIPLPLAPLKKRKFAAPNPETS